MCPKQVAVYGRRGLRPSIKLCFGYQTVSADAYSIYLARMYSPLAHVNRARHDVDYLVVTCMIPRIVCQWPANVQIYG